MRWKSVAGAALVATVSLGSLGLLASADHVSLEDPNDVRGALDIRNVRLHGSERPRWKVLAWSGWSTAEMWDMGYVTVLLDTVGDGRSDYYVLIGSAGNRMYAELWRDRADRRDLRLSGVEVWRPGRKSVSVKLPLRKMKIGERRTFYRWRIETIFTGKRCRRACFDLAPDDGFVVQPFGGQTPLPTPTITPQPTPSSSS